jgi:uncharacterized protein YidB (DUF937 family)
MAVFDLLKNLLGQTGGAEGAPMEGGGREALADAIEGASPGGMGGLIAKLHEGGLGGAASSWAAGEAQQVSGEQIRAALGDEHIEGIANRLGVQPDQALSFLQEHLPALTALRGPTPTN